MNPMQATALTADALSRLACPVCHQQLEPADHAIRCTGCGRTFPIVDGIPVLIESRATVA